MAGIKEAPVGVPKVEVTLKLFDEKTLHATAFYRNGDKKRQLTFQVRAAGTRQRREMAKREKAREPVAHHVVMPHADAHMICCAQAPQGPNLRTVATVDDVPSGYND